MSLPEKDSQKATMLHGRLTAQGHLPCLNLSSSVLSWHRPSWRRAGRRKDPFFLSKSVRFAAARGVEEGTSAMNKDGRGSVADVAGMNETQ